MQAKRTDIFLVLRFETGEDLLAKMLEALHLNGVNQGFVISGIGHLAPVRLGYFVGEGRYEEVDFPGGGELLNLSGNISLKAGSPFPHLHATLGRQDFGVFGGHVVSATVDVTCEVLILVVPESVRMVRKMEPETKLFGLYLE